MHSPIINQLATSCGTDSTYIKNSIIGRKSLFNMIKKIR